jgi:hypothetical protein
VTPIVVIATLVLLGSTGKNEVGRPEAPPTGSSTGAADLGQRAAPVELRISPAVVEIKHMPRATLVNTGNATVQSSHIFKLERKTIAGWRWINRRQAWRLPVLFLEPGQGTHPQPIGIWRANPEVSRCPRAQRPCCIRVLLRPGLYRVTKAAELVTGRNRGRDLIVRATFRVVERPAAG